NYGGRRHHDHRRHPRARRAQHSRGVGHGNLYRPAGSCGIGRAPAHFREMTEGYSMREATMADAGTILRHRREMFFDMGHQDPAALDEMVRPFHPWLVEKMAKAEYRGWFAISENGFVAAGVGLWLMNWPPGLYSLEPWRGNILNVY